MTLLQECIGALKNDVYILSEYEKNIVEEIFLDTVPFTNWGRVDWSIIKNKKEIKSIEELSEINNDKEFYIIWSDTDLPIIKSKAGAIFNNLDDVIAVSFDTWLFSIDKKLTVEFYHDGDITIGLTEN